MSVDSGTKPGLPVSETEQQLIDRAVNSLTECRWTVGECAFKWTQRYARGRTDAEFANLISLSPDQVYQRRRVWERFHAVRESYQSLHWSHFYTALTWDNAEECLQWAEDTRSTVGEMRAWRRAQLGEDLTQAGSDGEPLFQYVPEEPSWVQPPFDVPGSGGSPRNEMRRGEPSENDPARLAGVAREVGESDAAYAPFRQGAMRPGTATAPEKERGPAIPAATPEQIIKRMTLTLDRCLKVFTPEFVSGLTDLPDGMLARLKKSAAALHNQLERFDE